MAERHVVDAVEHGGGHGRDAADGDVPFAVARFAAGDEGVGEDDGAGAGRAGGEVGAHPVHGGGEDGLVPGALHTELVPDEGGLQVGQAVEGDVPVRVGQQYGGATGGGFGAQVDAGPAHEPRADPETAGRVVVPGDHHRGHAQAGEPVQRVVEQLDRGERRHRPVVHVPDTTTASTSRSRTVETRWPMNSACAPSMPTRWKDRPRCQSEVCRILKTPLRPACLPLLDPWTRHRSRGPHRPR